MKDVIVHIVFFFFFTFLLFASFTFCLLTLVGKRMEAFAIFWAFFAALLVTFAYPPLLPSVLGASVGVFVWYILSPSERNENEQADHQPPQQGGGNG